jgi:hypothetical protein
MMRTMSYGLVALAIGALLTAAVGLRHRATGQDQDRLISVQGVIAEIIPTGADDANVEGKILVEGQLEKDTQYDRMVVAVLNNTRIRRTNDPSWVGTLADLAVGRPVEVWFPEKVWVTYPPQVKAEAIHLLD